ncbi:hypothetical protein [Nonomuraea pusilla]|uniref:DUF1648 domain-containing protein n=1 Tax=Nonomuraea pusilla TaxID=46177 RepID=A0A1H7N6S7_9ACTN|nr:hypothetical protein [Nonomuraea pusilla]SEL19019.1 hypothetical protein SAMN05660976_01928 [Nonomuraea pusilla]
MTPRAIAASWGLLVATLLAGVPLALRDRLPDPLATHWSGSVPDGSMSFTVHVLSDLGLWALLWGSAFGIALYGRALRRRLSRTYFWGGLFGGGVFVLGVAASSLAANLDAPTWSDARMPGWHVALVLGLAAATGALAGRLGRGEPDQRPPEGERPPRLKLGPGRRSVWVGRVSNPWLTGLTAVAAAGLAAVALLSLTGAVEGETVTAALPALALALLAGVFTSSVSVRVTEDGVAIGFGPLGWPVRRIRLSQIDTAWSETRYPSQVGGWGLRGFPGTATIMLRGGDCLILRYRSGGQLAVSIDDAARAASLINALIPDRGPSTPSSSTRTA